MSGSSSQIFVKKPDRPLLCRVLSCFDLVDPADPSTILMFKKFSSKDIHYGRYAEKLASIAHEVGEVYSKKARKAFATPERIMFCAPERDTFSCLTVLRQFLKAHDLALVTTDFRNTRYRHVAPRAMKSLAVNLVKSRRAVLVFSGN